ncbi:Hypothetical protein MVR_LOCUS33 [uncultured virus]|nr:Hypothetical protein MVR_LOCUS33 [uncultured virus]
MLKFPEYITSTTPLPSGLDYRWLAKCLTNVFVSERTPTYGHICSSTLLYIRSVFADNTTTLVGTGIELYIPTMKYRCGTFMNDKLQGQGTVIAIGYSYVGEFISDRFNGLGTLTYKGIAMIGNSNEYKNGENYHGYFIDNRRSGFGTYNWNDGSYYTGQWNSNSKQGNGMHVWSSGSKYIGEYRNSERHGYGKFIKYSGQVFAGRWEDDVPIGCNFGVMYYRCETCQVEMCDRCFERNHRRCEVKRMWSAIEDRIFGCGCKG